MWVFFSVSSPHREQDEVYITRDSKEKTKAESQ